MDLDVFVTTHRAEWARLEQLCGRRRLTGAEADELVDLYQRVASHLSQVQSAAPDPLLVGRLTSLVARARSAVTGARSAGWRDAGRYFAADFPAALYRTRHWWVPTALASLALVAVVAVWVATDADVRAAIAAPGQIREMTRPGGEYEAYYSSHPASSFAAQVWTNNAWAAALCLVGGVFLGLPVLYALVVNVVNLGIGVGVMASAGRLGLFLGLLLPHGMLELSAVFVAAGLGLRLAWTVIDPGPRTRAVALAEEGRAIIGTIVGLTAVLLVSGVLEAFVTPSPLPTWARIGIGGLAEALFLAYVFVVGRRAFRAGHVGDVEAADRADELPVAA
ncbi:stage II sporulation protein M [Streptacidiphilus sp. ASG 303]|uniref:stage II sporulation protein M n=1 Tax=Streptacidiphilus sp. ASG 303 TaxID=2896847 RepID=UPI001E5716FA|nr:stage II sporulation protein M [Streptacidiphilus sp. ASG 303]MCD0481762.1 stage II sporulation protein M [Streptacidiphilus sp. ASG 303]